MTPVVQEDRTGCGIACVATVVGVPYRTVKADAQALGIRITDARLWTGTRLITTLFAHYGVAVDARRQPFRSWDALPPLALLAIKWHRRGPRAEWHWVVFSRTARGAVVFDSKAALATHRRTDFGRMRPKWSLALTRTSA